MFAWEQTLGIEGPILLMQYHRQLKSSIELYLVLTVSAFPVFSCSTGPFELSGLKAMTGTFHIGHLKWVEKLSK